MELRHYPRLGEFIFDRTRDYQFKNDHPHSREEGTFKPKGLWVSVEGDYGWKDFCENENFLEETVTDSNTYTVVLNEKNDILFLNTIEDLRTFTTNHLVRPDDPRYLEGIQMIDWVRVQRDYGGIIINPYQHTVRFDLFWYYSWDCASGAIWNLNNVKDIFRTYSDSED